MIIYLSRVESRRNLKTKVVQNYLQNWWIGTTQSVEIIDGFSLFIDLVQIIKITL